MRMYTFVLIILILITLIPDLFFYYQLKKKSGRKVWSRLSLIPGAFFILIFIVMKMSLKNIQDHRIIGYFSWVNFSFLLIYIPKLVYLLFYTLQLGVNTISKVKIRLIQQIGLCIAIFIAIAMLQGAFITTKQVEVITQIIPIKNLPESFDGFKIVQISDIHLGGWEKDYKHMTPIIDSINNQSADIIVFTGDMINNYHEETEGWSPYFQQLKSHHGKFAILGNHDYGDYSHWESPNEKEQNLILTKKAITDFGFHLLLNEHIYLHKGSDSIALVGVENWGKPPFPKYGKLQKSLQGINKDQLKIILSHDPTHWEAEIIKVPNAVLTLAGHTHAAQVGIYFNDKLYSPSSWIYKYWDGLNKLENHFLYINRGLGFVGLPMRIGVKPEISLLILKRLN